MNLSPFNLHVGRRVANNDALQVWCWQDHLAEAKQTEPGMATLPSGLLADDGFKEPYRSHIRVVSRTRSALPKPLGRAFRIRGLSGDELPET